MKTNIEKEEVLDRIVIKKRHDKIYLNVQIIKALRKSQDNSDNTMVKNAIQDNINKLCNENDNMYKTIVELGGQ